MRRYINGANAPATTRSTRTAVCVGYDAVDDSIRAVFSEPTRSRHAVSLAMIETVSMVNARNRSSTAIAVRSDLRYSH
jgi:hypothetical protein